MCSPAKSGLLAPRNEGKHTLEEPWNISLNKGKEELECFGKSRVQVKCDSLTQKREINDTVNIRSNTVKIDPEVCFFGNLECCVWKPVYLKFCLYFSIGYGFYSPASSPVIF